MSQRLWTTPQYEVLTGWDRPLQYFFLVITPREEDAEPSYSNLTDPDGPALSLEYIADLLDCYDIEPPPSLWFDLLKDKALNRGNFVHEYAYQCHRCDE